MLAPKKIEKKKLFISIFIMSAMLGGTGFLLYKNYLLKSQADEPSVAPPQFEKVAVPVSLKSNLTSPGLSPGENAKTVATTSPANASVDQQKINKLLDVSIFLNEKFKALREYATSTTQKISSGKKNPFEP